MTDSDSTPQPIDILLVEDNPGDVRLTQEALAEAKVRNRLHVVRDGEAAMDFLRRSGEHGDAPRPDLVLLDLNLPKLSGMEVLQAMKDEPKLRQIPVVILTTSEAEEDVLRGYQLQASAYVTKPVDLDRFLGLVQAIDDFWLAVVRYPKEGSA